MTFDVPEFERWSEAAHDQIETAQRLAELGLGNDAVLHAEQAVQLLFKALLYAVGANDNLRSHGLSKLARRCVDEAGMDLPSRLADQLRILERDYLPSRYPDALSGGTPRTAYGAADVERAMATVEATRDAVTSAWEQLRAAERDDESGGTS